MRYTSTHVYFVTCCHQPVPARTSAVDVTQEKEIPKSNDGQLSLRVIRAQDLQETGVIKYQDPFVVMETSRAKFETSVAKGAGRDPEWKEAFEFAVASGSAADPFGHTSFVCNMR